MKKYKLFSFFLALLMILTVFVACGTGEPEATTANIDFNTLEIINKDGTKFTPDLTNVGKVAKNPRNLGSTTFELAGTAYTFPIKMSELHANGWTLSEGTKDKTEVNGNSSIILMGYSLVHESGMKIKLSQIFNESEEKKDILECTLTKFSVYTSDCTAEQGFVLPGGITNQSTAANILTYFGDPHGANAFANSDNYENSVYYIKHEISNLTYFFSFQEDGSLSDVEIDIES